MKEEEDAYPVRRAPALFNFAGLACFAGAFLVGYCLGIHPIGSAPDSWGWGALGQRILGFLATATLGFVCGIIAAFRREHYWAITGIALLLNAPPLFVLMILLLNG